MRANAYPAVLAVKARAITQIAATSSAVAEPAQDIGVEDRSVGVEREILRPEQTDFSVSSLVASAFVLNEVTTEKMNGMNISERDDDQHHVGDDRAARYRSQCDLCAADWPTLARGRFRSQSPSGLLPPSRSRCRWAEITRDGHERGSGDRRCSSVKRRWIR